MYIQNFNISFIYLMTSTKMLADKDKCIYFKIVKPRILPFLAKSKEEYQDLANYIYSI